MALREWCMGNGNVCEIAAKHRIGDYERLIDGAINDDEHLIGGAINDKASDRRSDQRLSCISVNS